MPHYIAIFVNKFSFILWELLFIFGCNSPNPPDTLPPKTPSKQKPHTKNLCKSQKQREFHSHYITHARYHLRCW